MHPILAQQQERLRKLGAGEHLVEHHRLVFTAALVLTNGLLPIVNDLRVEEVLAGAALHDAGKIVHLEELHQPGKKHEQAGQTLLMDNGVDERIARYCVSHGNWTEESELEHLLVALADKLWKGVRKASLEEKVARAVAERAGRDYWDVEPVVAELCVRVGVTVGADAVT